MRGSLYFYPVTNTYQKYAIIVAGGSGSRMHSSIPKQFLLLNDLPVLMHTIKAFFIADNKTKIVLVLPETQIPYWNELCSKYHFFIKHDIVNGGETRFHSVLNALNTISNEDSIIAVHDGVRPLASRKLITRCFEEAHTHKAVIPTIPVSDSIRLLDNGNSKALNRTQYHTVQTPQCFAYNILKEAYQQPFTDAFTDDASVVETDGYKIVLVEGEASNIKITTPVDMAIAGALLNTKPENE